MPFVPQWAAHPKALLSTTRPDDLAAAALTNALERVPGLDKAEVEDVILGCAQQEGESGWNMARMTALRAQLPDRRARHDGEPALRLRP